MDQQRREQVGGAALPRGAVSVVHTARVLQCAANSVPSRQSPGRGDAISLKCKFKLVREST